MPKTRCFSENVVKIVAALEAPPPSSRWPPAAGASTKPRVLFSFLCYCSFFLTLGSNVITLYYCWAYKKTKCGLLSNFHGDTKIFLSLTTPLVIWRH